MNWQKTYRCLQELATAKGDMGSAIAALQAEVRASSVVSTTDQQTLLELLGALTEANLYGRISLLSKVKETLSKYAPFAAMYPALGSPRE